MDSSLRTAMKAATWQISGFLVMSLIGYIMTGSLETAGGFAFASAAIGTVAFFVHEKLWARVKWGRSEAPQDTWLSDRPLAQHEAWTAATSR
ncbi:MAG: DUF2061 domain-containing protein [Kiloniellales bacterium]